MNKEQFLKLLNKGIKNLPEEEREDILRDFEEHFQIGLAEGKTEEEISRSLGSPKQIAKEMAAAYHVEKVEGKTTISNILRATWAVIGLGFFNLTIVLGPFIALIGILASGWIAGVSFTVSPLFALLNALIYPDTFQLFELFLSIAFCGFGLLMVTGMFYVTRSLSKLFIKYLKYNVNLVKGGIENEYSKNHCYYRYNIDGNRNCGQFSFLSIYGSLIFNSKGNSGFRTYCPFKNPGKKRTCYHHSGEKPFRNYGGIDW